MKASSRKSRADELMRRAAATRGMISFAGGLPDPARFPKKQLSQAFLGGITRHADVALQYSWPEGDESLRREIAKLLRARGARVPIERIIITSGAQQALSVAALAAPQRRTIAVEPESYPGAMDAFRAMGARLVSLDAPADLQYLMPSVSNPRGTRLSATQRREALARARKHGYVIEDDAYDGTTFAQERSRPLLAMAPDRVFHVGTFSKTLSPGLRIGWLVVPPRLRERALAKKQQQDLQASGLAQALLVEYLRSGHLIDHQRRSANAYRHKLQRLQRAVARALPQFRFDTPIGGFSLWLESELEVDELELLEAAVGRRVSFDLASAYRARPSSKLALRLCYSAVPTAKIETGVKRLSQALAEVQKR